VFVCGVCVCGEACVQRQREERDANGDSAATATTREGWTNRHTHGRSLVNTASLCSTVERSIDVMCDVGETLITQLYSPFNRSSLSVTHTHTSSLFLSLSSSTLLISVLPVWPRHTNQTMRTRARALTVESFSRKPITGHSLTHTHTHTRTENTTTQNTAVA
jgi:hypothetical protein